jgi:nucleotide-binding universal stress UspA family protein
MKKILVAYDGGRPARRALELAAELAQLFDAKVGVVSVSSYQSLPGPVDPWDDEPSSQQSSSRPEASSRSMGSRPSSTSRWGTRLE